MMKKLLLLGMFSTGLGAAGCYAGVAYTEPAPVVVAAGPNMVVVDEAPGVQVITDYDYPVFFTGGMYWRNDGGIWYSSRWHDRGWGRTYDVPVAVRGIDRPERFAHYHAPAGSVRTNAGIVRGNRTETTHVVNNTAVVRDHRSEPVAARPAPAKTVVRDHRH